MPSTTALPSAQNHSVLALLVDRDADTRRMYAEYLRLALCEIEEAGDGREALAKAISRRPDVIVTETRLPGISGFDLCGLLRTDTTTQEIPIVVVTGDAYPAAVSRAEDAGANVVLLKPCLPEKLLDAMRQVLEHSASLRARATATREKLAGQLTRSGELLQRSRRSGKKPLSRAYKRHDTISPPIEPPALICPTCDQPLIYQRSHIGGVSARHSEQWDYYVCPSTCGTFQYRERTRKLRKVL
jgi:two-component system, cell cycle response regulator DivK